MAAQIARAAEEEREGGAKRPRSPLGAADGAASGTPLKGEAAGATTYKSQMDEVLYGRDYDQSGDYKSIREGIAASAEFGGAAGLSSFAESKKAPLRRVEIRPIWPMFAAKVPSISPKLSPTSVIFASFWNGDDRTYSNYMKLVEFGRTAAATRGAPRRRQDRV